MLATNIRVSRLDAKFNLLYLTGIYIQLFGELEWTLTLEYRHSGRTRVRIMVISHSSVSDSYRLVHKVKREQTSKGNSYRLPHKITLSRARTAVHTPILYCHSEIWMENTEKGSRLAGAQLIPTLQVSPDALQDRQWYIQPPPREQKKSIYAMRVDAVAESYLNDGGIVCVFL